MYVCGLVIPVPENSMDAYRRRAEDAWRPVDGLGWRFPIWCKRLILGCFQPISKMGRHDW